ncbi:MAG: hypothetical protein KJ850_08840 [Gammaproteobacteria bacterium]|nr:hypothetical protein [Gammaproteobacteria bacterium]MBU1625143.1 hypothetical protein [Gammaproteobacteria bacterium]MBU1981403.1 hypothetical protein [Gammaproteobacteria bacterium]
MRTAIPTPADRSRHFVLSWLLLFSFFPSTPFGPELSAPLRGGTVRRRFGEKRGKYIFTFIRFNHWRDDRKTRNRKQEKQSRDSQDEMKKPGLPGFLLHLFLLSHHRQIPFGIRQC